MNQPFLSSMGRNTRALFVKPAVTLLRNHRSRWSEIHTCSYSVKHFDGQANAI